MSNKDELTKLVEQMQEKIASLETELAATKAAQPIPEEDLVVIAASAAAFMGLKGKVKAIQFAGRSGTTSLASA